MIRTTTRQLAFADWLEQGGDYEAAAELRDCPYVIGQEYYFRLATYAWVGRIVAVGPQEIVIDGASCVFSSGDISVAMRDGFGKSAELEPVEGQVVMGRGAVVDAIPYKPQEWSK